MSPLLAPQSRRCRRGGEEKGARSRTRLLIIICGINMTDNNCSVHFGPCKYAADAGLHAPADERRLSLICGDGGWWGVKGKKQKRWAGGEDCGGNHD